MNSEALLQFAAAMRVLTVRMEALPAFFPPAAAADVRAIAEGAPKAREVIERVQLHESLWRLSPPQAEAEIRRVLASKVAHQLAHLAVAESAVYHRLLGDGTEAPPEAAGKRIATHRMAVRFLLIPLTLAEENEHG